MNAFGKGFLAAIGVIFALGILIFSGLALLAGTSGFMMGYRQAKSNQAQKATVENPAPEPSALSTPQGGAQVEEPQATNAPPKKSELPPLTPAQIKGAASLLSQMVVTEDKILRVKTLQFDHPADESGAVFYFCKAASGEPWPQIQFRSCLPRALLVKSLTIRADDEFLSVRPESFERSHQGGNVVEYANELAKDHRKVVDAILNAKTVVIRFNGADKYFDHEMTAAELNRFRNAFLVYRYAGGQW